ncbi:hypothetical protein J3E68DRAFT_444325 [Trichoderma sp. SZMC 28012]
MQLSALLALLPLAAALPQSRGPVEARDGQVDGCTAQADQCYSNCRARFSHGAGFIEPIVYKSCYTGCNDALWQCTNKNATEKRSVEAAPVEIRSSKEDECQTAYDDCCAPFGKGTYSEGRNLMILACPGGRDQCSKAFNDCMANQAEKRSVEEAPVETRSSKEDECQTAYDDCCAPFGKGTYSEGRNLMIMACPGGRGQCSKVFNDCMANQAEKRSVKEAPVETRSSKEDECNTAYDDCCAPFGKGTYSEGRNLMILACPGGRGQCSKVYNDCMAKPTGKRSVEKAARDNGSEATTACYGSVASCRHKGTPVAECYSNLARCIQDVLKKFT